MIYNYGSEAERILSSIATVKQNSKDKTARIYLRVSEQEKKDWLERAESYHVGLSDYIRTVINYSEI